MKMYMSATKNVYVVKNCIRKMSYKNEGWEPEPDGTENRPQMNT
jgi:hypothetical protein